MILTPREHSPTRDLNPRNSINEHLDFKGLRRGHAASMYSKRDNSRPRHTELNNKSSFIINSTVSRAKESPRTTI